jgi:hypothetical protein
MIVNLRCLALGGVTDATYEIRFASLGSMTEREPLHPFNRFGEIR